MFTWQSHNHPFHTHSIYEPPAPPGCANRKSSPVIARMARPCGSIFSVRLTGPDRFCALIRSRIQTLTVLASSSDPHFVAGLRYTQEFQAMRPVRARSFLRAAPRRTVAYACVASFSPPCDHFECNSVLLKLPLLKIPGAVACPQSHLFCLVPLPR